MKDGGTRPCVMVEKRHGAVLFGKWSHYRSYYFDSRMSTFPLPPVFCPPTHLAMGS